MNGAGHLRVGEAPRLIAYLPERERTHLAHVLSCGDCHDRVKRLLAAVPSPPPEPTCGGTGSGGAPGGAGYAAVLDRVEAGLAATAEQVAAERSRAADAVTVLLLLPPDMRRRRVRCEPQFRTLAVATLLLECAFEAVAAPDEAENLALLALSIAARLDPTEAPSFLVGELKVHAWSLVALACRLRGDWRLVREALEAAEEAMVFEGYCLRRTGFRRALACLRLAERRVEAARAAAARAVDRLLGPLVERAAGGQGDERAD